MTPEELSEIKKIFENRLIFGKPTVTVNMTEYDLKLWFHAPKFFSRLIEEVENCWGVLERREASKNKGRKK